MQYVTLSNGVKMPQLGYGVYQVTQGECERCVLDALSEDDMRAIAALDKKQSTFFSHYDPNMVEWFVKMVEERKTKHNSAAEKKNW